MAYVGLKVKRLIRVRYGPFSLGKLPPGGIEEVPQNVLHRSLGKYFEK
jgi:23S rRNA pseudouridine2605 synthase